MPGFDPKFKVTVRRIEGELHRRDCNYNVNEILEYQPYCGCSFFLFDPEDGKSLSNALWSTINEGVRDFRRILEAKKDLILATIIAYEVEMRLCEFGLPGIREYGWYHATLTAFAAPLAAGRGLGYKVIKNNKKTCT